MVKPPCSNFRVITAIFRVSEHIYLEYLRYIISLFQLDVKAAKKIKDDEDEEEDKDVHKDSDYDSDTDESD